MKDELELFSGDDSAEMWQRISRARSMIDLKFALYTVCNRVKELERRTRAFQASLEKGIASAASSTPPVTKEASSD